MKYYLIVTLTAIVAVSVTVKSDYVSEDDEDGQNFHGRTARQAKKQKACKSDRGTTIQRYETHRQRDGIDTVIFKEDADCNRILGTSKGQKKEATEMLDSWLSGSSSGKTGGTTEQTSKYFRLDRQGITQTSNYGNLMNWQVQLNGPKPKKGPTSVAHVNIPESLDGYTNAEWRQLMVYTMKKSLEDGATFWVVQGSPDKSGNLDCPQTRANGK